MNPVDANTVARFAEAFAAGRSGMTADQIPQYFGSYQGGVPVAASFAHNPSKPELFATCLSTLSPENQRQALYDLCDSPPLSKNPMPDESTRVELLRDLVQADGRSPLGVCLSKVTLSGVREAWFTAASRLPTAPAAAVTAARTLVETTCKTILAELGTAADNSGNLVRLFKQTRKALGIDASRNDPQRAYQISSGLIQIIEGLAGLSNAAGDRHGTISGVKILDCSYAGLAVHAAGTVSLFLSRAHRSNLRGPVA